ncbi:MAG: hypothetical protein GF390_01375 [Candidatus Pacebacteria bacterium]|nr:hypothetical protein [Candidatus Paceibacterota bacterium]
MAKFSLRRAKKFLSLVSLGIALVFSLFQLWQQLQQDQFVLGQVDERGFEKVLVTEVIDGDTIKLSDGRKVRYIGIDTPETKDPRVGQECFGQEAAQHNQQLVENKVVYLEKDVNDTDRYGRLLRYVWLDGQMINQQLVVQGYAFASSYPPDVAYQKQLRLAEQQAREAGLGLWSACKLNDVEQLNELIQQVDADFE